MKKNKENQAMTITPRFLPFQEPGETISGEYLGSQYIEVGYDLQDGTKSQLQYYVLGPDGVAVFNATHQLYQSMAALRPGMVIRVTFTGTEKTRSYQVKGFRVELLEPPDDWRSRILETFGVTLAAPAQRQALPEPGLAEGETR